MIHDAMATYEAGVPIGLGIWWEDCDLELGTRDTHIGTASPDYITTMFISADYLNDAYLVDNPLYPITAVGASSWGAVKASFR